MQRCNVHDLGLVGYQPAWDLQNRLSAEIASGARPATLLLLEHPHTYTFGRQGDQANLLWNDTQLAERGISTYWVDRGGDVTYHGPGQLVGYPLLPLGSLDRNSRIPEADYVGYVRKLEQTLILALAQFGLAAGQMTGLTGVWVQADIYSRCPRCHPDDREKPAKIAAIGVKVDANGVTRHGFALNVAPDMEYWQGIIPCGITAYPVTCMAELMREPPPTEKVKEKVISAFGEIFGYEMIMSTLQQE